MYNSHCIPSFALGLKMLKITMQEVYSVVTILKLLRTVPIIAGLQIFPSMYGNSFHSTEVQNLTPICDGYC